MNGVINVLKPPGMTSHDVVSFIRKELGIKKVGHTGTLDPEAAGVLPLCVGKATKIVQYLVEKKKVYRANIKFGIETTTQDKLGDVTKQINTPDVDQEYLEELMDGFKGKILQTPPMYSAIKYKGKKLYEYALDGVDVEVKSRYVEIYSINIVDKISKDEFILDISCSKGTYIRTLCHDIGRKSGFGAHMSQLVRLEVSPFRIENSVTLEEIANAVKDNNIKQFIWAPDLLLEEFKAVHIKKSAEKSALNGNHIFAPGIDGNLEIFDEGAMVRLYIDNEFLAIGTIKFDERFNRKYVKIKTLFV